MHQGAGDGSLYLDPASQVPRHLVGGVGAATSEGSGAVLSASPGSGASEGLQSTEVPSSNVGVSAEVQLPGMAQIK